MKSEVLLICAITGEECHEETLSEGKKPCKVCNTGKEWLDKNNGVILHDDI